MNSFSAAIVFMFVFAMKWHMDFKTALMALVGLYCIRKMLKKP